MLRRIAIRKDGTISISEFRKFTEKYQGEIDSLEEENKKLKEYNGELIENHKKDIAILCEENKKLNIKVASLEGEIKGLNYVIDKLREELSAYDREYFDEDKKAKNIFMEEDTLQELRDIGEI